MRLSWNEIKLRADAFSEDWKDAAYEKGETQSFYNDFFEIFGKKRREVSRFEEHVKKLNNRHGFIDLFWPGVLIVEQKSAGKDLDKAAEQAGEYYDALPDKQKPRYQLVCDFQNFHLLDRDERKKISFTLAELPEKLDYFRFMLGEDSVSYQEQKELSIDASRLMGRIHDALLKSGYKGKKLEIFLTRLTFCLFADNTGIFENRLFQTLIKRTREGVDMGLWIGQIFETLDTHKNDRQDTLDADMKKLPYVNGGLFEEKIGSTSLDITIRENLIYVAGFKWNEISPAIFGSMFQSVMDEKERREQGAHYTGEHDILKLINSLFMDDLWREFEQIKKRPANDGRKKILENFQNKLASMTFFDPACGCGNFLVIAYRELRWLEIEVLLLLHPKGADGKQQTLDASDFSKIDVHQFYGLEINDFAVHIARSALWMMDHFMNIELGKKFGQWIPRIPLEKSPTIVCADALDTDWADLLSPNQCSFIFGNPPFSGQSYQSKNQREQMRVLTKPEGKNATPLDYVGAWFLKSAAYVRQADHNIPFAFVATNSITQGEQVALLWQPLLHEHNLDIIFAHQAFAWESEAPGKASVHVVIVGLEKQEHARANKMLFSYEELKGDPIGKSVLAISPYLFDASRFGNLANPNLIINDSREPITQRAIMKRGIQPTDGGHYIFRGDEIANFLKKEPKAKKFMRPFIGGTELVNNKKREILYLKSAKPNELKEMPLVLKKIQTVMEERKASRKPATQKMALYPALLEGSTIPTKPFLAIPQVNSTNRTYVPIGFLSPPTIPSNLVNVVSGASLFDFALLNSAMHMAWLRQVGGRLGNSYRYSIGLVYNTFPLPLEKDLSKLERHGQAILDARAENPKATLADLYDPTTMPPNLTRAHEANDRAVDRLYSAQPFADDTARINHLFVLYEKQTSQ